MDPMKDENAPQPSHGSSDQNAPGDGPPRYGTAGHDAPGYGAGSRGWSQDDLPRDEAWGYDIPGAGATAPTAPTPTTSMAPVPTTPVPTTAAPVQHRRGPGWGGVGALVVLGMVLSSGATLGGVVVYDQFLNPDPEVSSQPGTTAEARPAAVVTGEAPNWATVAEQVSPSTVAIQVSTSAGTSQGTGVILDEQGAILTNNHVVEGSRAIRVTTSDGLGYAASVVGTDPTTDLAVIRVDSPPEDLKPATFADSSTVEVGQPVMALGTPLGLENTVTTGIISALDRPVTAAGEKGDGSAATYTSALQTDAAINPGNSGGPLVDAAGQVIGINSAIAAIPNASGQAGSIGLGFAIPASTASMIADQLREDGTADHAFVGVTSTDGTATGDGATYSGAEVISVEPGSPAGDSSLRKGDLIIAVDDTSVGGAAGLTGVVRGLEIGSTHQLEVVRDGAVQSIEVTLAERPS
ncbi:MAG: trypsin-like peptidase domain-containing protein [Brachybacterium sp.]|nr:trypsin-like peptidase domain-containing protein [Brachybacterium sp.]MDN5901042.1 trypsin-like peptidase domain-containing protein [Brachybacterium sp.]